MTTKLPRVTINLTPELYAVLEKRFVEEYRPAGKSLSRLVIDSLGDYYEVQIPEDFGAKHEMFLSKKQKSQPSDVTQILPEYAF